MIPMKTWSKLETWKLHVYPFSSRATQNNALLFKKKQRIVLKVTHALLLNHAFIQNGRRTLKWTHVSHMCWLMRYFCVTGALLMRKLCVTFCVGDALVLQNNAWLTHGKRTHGTLKVTHGACVSYALLFAMRYFGARVGSQTPVPRGQNQRGPQSNACKVTHGNDARGR